MSELLIQAMPPGLDIGGGYQIRLTAYDPTSGALVTGVSVSSVAIQARQVSGGPDLVTPTPLIQPSEAFV